MGSGPIQAGEPVIIDLWPRDADSACFADMTRTFVVGEAPAELRHYHQLTREALARSLAAVRPGVAGREVYRISCEPYEQAGLPTLLSKARGQVLEEGYFHSLGHGVGLEVHEAPTLGRGSGVLVAGDVVTLEPGCYRPGFGGCRLEDLVLVTEDGAELLTDSRTISSPERTERPVVSGGRESAVGARSARVHAVAFLHAFCGVCLPVSESPRPAAPQPAHWLLLHRLTVDGPLFSRGRDAERQIARARE
jgi:Xaa-Pro aminopeptidase